MAKGFTWQETSQEEKEACVVRLFQRFPDVLLHLGDPQLAQQFDLPSLPAHASERSAVKLKQQLTEDVLTVELSRRRKPWTSSSYLSHGGYGSVKPSWAQADTAQEVAQALDAMTATLTSLAPSRAQVLPISQSAREVLALNQSFTGSSLAAEVPKEAKLSHRQTSTHLTPPRHELAAKIEVKSSSSSPSFGRPSAVKCFAKKSAKPLYRQQEFEEQEDEVWVPGQSSDEELLARSRSAHGISTSSSKSKRDASPTASDKSFESPFFPFLRGVETGTTASPTSSNSIDLRSLRSPAAQAARQAWADQGFRTPSDGDLLRGSGGSGSRGLGARRGLALQLSSNSKTSRSSMVPPPLDDDGRSGTPPSASSKMTMRIAETEEPAVQLLFQTEPKRRPSRCNTIPADMMLAIGPRILQVAKVPRPLPAAFPQRRNIIFFDWDDTLCPTSWIRSLLKEHLADMEEWLDQGDDCLETEEDWRDSIPSWFKQPLPDEPHVRQLIADLQNACIRTIRVAQSLGVVCIVTNAVPGWVEKTIKRWLPKLRTHIGVHSIHSQHPIKVIYAQQAYCDASLNLPFVDEQGEFMLWKRAAMAGALTELDHLYGLEDKSDTMQNMHNMHNMHNMNMRSMCSSSARLVNVISIGDTEAEMSAAELASQGLHSRHPKRGRLYRRACGLQDLPDSLQPDANHGDKGDKPQSRTSSKDGSKDESKDDASGSSGSESGSPPGERGERERVFLEGEFGPGRSRSVESSNRRAFGAFRPWVKLIKLSEGCQARRLTAQLEEIAQLLPKMLALRRHVRVDLTDLTEGSGGEAALRTLGCTEEDLQLERHLCVETV